MWIFSAQHKNNQLKTETN